jgi:putative membrane protein
VTPKNIAESSAESAARSGRAVERHTRELSRSVDRQVTLAADRTLLANERTYAAWVRTALAALASGVGARALLEHAVPLWLAKLTATVLILFAGFCLVAAVWRHLWRAVPPPPTDVKPIPRGALVPINAFLLLVAAAALFGIWAA